MRTRKAVTVVEVLVALVVFSIAALGSAAVLGVAARARAAAAARREAVGALRQRAAMLALIPCDALTIGQSVVAGVTVVWTIAVTDSLAHVALRATHRGISTMLRTEIVCR
jgi:Tfp pilus assembly protein PilV